MFDNMLVVSLALALCGACLQGCGSASGLDAAHADSAEVGRRTHSQSETYVEGRVINADYDRGRSYGTEQEVQVACSSDDGCKGYWQRASGEFYMLQSGSRTWEKGVPNGSVRSVKFKSAGPQLTPRPTPQPDEAYMEGRVSNADYDRNWYNSEEEIRAACSSDDDCKGYWQRTSGEYFMLKSGTETFEKGVPHETVLSVKVREASPVPVPQTYVEGRITNADYDRNWYNSEEEIRAACSSDDDCKGYWQRTSGEYFMLKSGTGTFEKGVPHETVLSVKAKEATPVSSPPPQPTPQPTPQSTPQPTPKPPATDPSRDTRTVSPEEWDYFLAFQQSRKMGFACPCGNGWHECNDSEANKNHWPPNAEKATFDCKLWIAAYRHADDQAIQGYFSHTGKDGRSERQRAADVGAKSRGEHQAGWHSTGAGAHWGLKSSPGHCNSMFQTKYRGIAVGHGARRNDPRGDGDIWTVMYNYGGDHISDSESCIPEGYTATGDLK